jgi:hypothetical protein
MGFRNGTSNSLDRDLAWASTMRRQMNRSWSSYAGGSLYKESWEYIADAVIQLIDELTRFGYTMEQFNGLGKMNHKCFSAVTG